MNNTKRSSPRKGELLLKPVVIEIEESERLRRVYGELLPHVQSRAPLIPYHRLFCPSVWMNCSLLLGKLSTCLLSLASLQRTGRML